jgi:hypothetical protein
VDGGSTPPRKAVAPSLTRRAPADGGALRTSTLFLENVFVGAGATAPRALRPLRGIGESLPGATRCERRVAARPGATPALGANSTATVESRFAPSPVSRGMGRAEESAAACHVWSLKLR